MLYDCLLYTSDKQELVVQLLSERLPEAKVGIIFKGIAGISPEDIVRRLSKDSGEHLYMAAVGYDGIIEKDEEDVYKRQTPGRTMQYLIRDAAHPMHAVMGIASLENCAVQITCRDDFIGWNQKAYIEKMLKNDSTAARQSFSMLLGYISDGISGIDYSELCTQATIDNPTDEDIQALQDIAADAEQRRQQLLKDSLESEIEEEKSELGSISKDTEKALYHRKKMCIRDRSYSKSKDKISIRYGL